MWFYNSEDYNHKFMPITRTVCLTCVTAGGLPLLKIIQPHRQLQNIYN